MGDEKPKQRVEALSDYLMSLELERFYGEVSIVIKNGVIVRVKTERTFSGEDLESFLPTQSADQI